MRIKTILNNCIYKILESNEFKNIYVYGSQNLELEKFISKITSSSILGGDVDFYNALFGCYYNKHEINDSNMDEIKRVFEFQNEPKPQKEEKTKEELEKQIEDLQAKLEQKQQEDEYQQWLKEREERRKRRKQKDFEM